MDQKVVRHSVYLTDSVWDNLRKNAIDKRTNANAIITGLLRVFLQSSLPLPAGHYRSHVQNQALDQVRVRSVRIPVNLSKAVMERLGGKTSFSNLVDYVVRLYQAGHFKEALDSQKTDDSVQTEQQDQTATNVVPSAGLNFVLGEKPFYINLDEPKNPTRPQDQ